MNIEHTREYLMQVRRISDQIRRKKERCEGLRDRLDVKAIQYDKVRVQTSPDTDKVAAVLSAVSDLEDEILELQLQKAELVNEICDKIEELESDGEKLVLLLLGAILGGPAEDQQKGG